MYHTKLAYNNADNLPQPIKLSHYFTQRILLLSDFATA